MISNRIQRLGWHLDVGRWLLVGAALALPGCDGGFSGGGGVASFDGGGGGFGGGGLSSPVADGFGATQGGVQDMGLARELIAAGQVPPAEAFVVEGMFSEHELGLEGGACERTLCLRGGVGLAPTPDGTASGWLQVGLSSSIDPENFERPSVTLIATVDVSGSMGWQYVTEQSENPTPGEVSRNLLSAIALELGSRDRMAIVTYGSTVETVLPLTNGQDQVTIQGAIDRLTTGGVTDMEGGMRRAYHLAAEAERQTDEVRVMVFTDVRPNVGATTATEFERLARTGSEQDVGLTVMAVGLGLGQEVLNAMSQIRGGNAFSLFDNQDVGDLMEDDWPWLLSPLAYDMRVALTLAPGYAVAESFGFPTGADEDKPMPELEVSTIFLSRRKGALLVRLVPEEAGDLTGLNVTGQLSYTTPAGELIEQQLDMAYGHLEPDAAGQFFEQASVGKTVALALLVQTMHQAALEYAESHELAVARMRAGFERFVADAEALGDDDLTAEVELAGELLRLMESGAAQGDLYEFGVY